MRSWFRLVFTGLVGVDNAARVAIVSLGVGVGLAIAVQACNKEVKEVCETAVLDTNGKRIECGDGPACTPCPPCLDGKKSGDETDVDCGGSCPKKCGNGQSCKVNADCDHDRCVGTQCNQGNPYDSGALDRCTNSVKDGDETDVDCGGSCAKKCGNGQSCKVNADCDHDRCVGTVCIQAPTCTDSFKNGDETDVDCGGSCPTKCALGKGCAINGDCTTNNCAGNTCGPPP